MSIEKASREAPTPPSKAKTGLTKLSPSWWDGTGLKHWKSRYTKAETRKEEVKHLPQHRRREYHKNRAKRNIRGDLEVSLTVRDAGSSRGISDARVPLLPVWAGRCCQAGGKLKQPGNACEQQRAWVTELGRQLSTSAHSWEEKHILHSAALLWELTEMELALLNGQHQVLSTAFRGPALADVSILSAVGFNSSHLFSSVPSP